MSRRHLSSARSNRKLVIESTTRSSEASNSTDRLSSGSVTNRRRGVRRENSSPRQDYVPNGKIFGGGNVSHRSKRLLVKSQNETSSSAFRLSEPGTSLSTTKPPRQKQSGHVKHEDLDPEFSPRPMSYSGQSNYGIPPGPQYPPSQYPPSQYPPSQYPPSQLAPGVMYAHQGSYFQPPSTDNSYESFLSRQYQINEMQRQEEVRRAEHKQRIAETQLLQQQQRELELKNAAMALEMEQEEVRRREREELLREQEEREREQQQREREHQIDRQLQQLQDPASKETVDPPPIEAQMSNEQLLNELAILKKAISASNSLNSTDEELLLMFSKLQVLQDILEKRNVEIDAAQLLARTFRRQSSKDVVPGQQLRRRSSLEEKPPARKSLSRQSSLENRPSASRRGSIERPTQLRRSSIDNKKSITRQSSGSMTSISSLGLDESRATSFSRQTSMGELSDDGAAYRESIDSVYGGGGDEEDILEVETDPRVIKLQQQISLLSSRILSKSFTDKTLLAMFDQLDDLKRELAMLKGIDIPFDGVRKRNCACFENYLIFSFPWS